MEPCTLYNDYIEDELGKMSVGYLAEFLETSLINSNKGNTYDELQASEFYHLLWYVETIL